MEQGAPGRRTATSFREWLGQIGLAHCGQVLLENGIDFDVAPDLTEDDLRSVGLNLGDTRRLLKALSRLDQKTSASSADAAGVVGVPSKPTDAPLGERRQLTVMFCDLVGYTELTQRLDPEELDDLIRAYRKACTKVVAHYDGYVAQRLGDGLMVYFGSPNAHEDDAERCLRSALDIVQAIKSVAFAEPLAVRIGIATGPVVVGEASRDGNGEDGLAVGETPNLAARLQGLAGPDEIVIGPTTRRLVGNTFDVADLGVHALKGIVAPMRAWRVQAVLRTEGRFDAAHGDDVTLTALVGRDEEVAQLLRHWHRARSGEGQVVLLGGEPGIGKSRLTQVLRESIKGEPHTAMRYQCSPFRLNSALYPSSSSQSSPPDLRARTPPSRSSTNWKPFWWAVRRTAPNRRRCLRLCSRYLPNAIPRLACRRGGGRRRFSMCSSARSRHSPGSNQY